MKKTISNYVNRNELIYNEFIKKKTDFEELRIVISSILSQMVEDHDIAVVGIQTRVKSGESLLGKLETKGYKYKSLSDITDIIGTRIITFYSDDVDKIANLVENIFEVDYKNSVDKRKARSEYNTFGYMSLHYILSVPESVYFDPTRPEYNSVRFELQIRTALQHVWATAEHDIGYKSNVDVPKQYLRRLSRLAGLLEIADEEFNSIINDIDEYKKKVGELVKNGSFDDLNLNADTFKSYLELEPYKDLNERISSVTGVEIKEAKYTKYLPLLTKLGFSLLADVEKLRNEYSEEAFKLALAQFNEYEFTSIPETMGLYNLLLVHQYKKEGTVDSIKVILDALNGSLKDNKNYAEILFDLLSQVKTF